MMKNKIGLDPILEVFQFYGTPILFFRTPTLLF